MQLAELTAPGLVFLGLEAKDGASLLRLLAQRIAESGVDGVAKLKHPEALYDKLQEREALCSTAIGEGVAVPHCKLKGLKQVLLAVGVMAEAIDFGAADGKPVQVFFVVVSPEGLPAEHLQCLAAISRWVREEGHVQGLLAEREPAAVLELLSDPPGES